MSANLSLAARFALGVTALLMSSCANVQHEVAGHRYNVPEASLIPTSAYPFFLPKTRGNAFIFYLNPQAEIRERRTVLVEGREEVCASANGGGYVSRTICGQDQIRWQGFDWIKTGDEVFWTYSPDNPDSTDSPFIACHKMEIEGHSGMCSATVPLGDLVLTIGLDDDEVPELQKIYRRAAFLLRSWEL